MTLKDIFYRCAELGDFPRVKIAEPVRHSNITTGKITAIRPAGISVRFDDMNYDTWFWVIDQKDNRKKYLSQLQFSFDD